MPVRVTLSRLKHTQRKIARVGFLHCVVIHAAMRRVVRACLHVPEESPHGRFSRVIRQ
jgi:hypothetical protein